MPRSTSETRRLDRFIRALDILTDSLAPERRADAPEISTREIQALRALGWAQELRMSDLAAWMRVPLSTASRIVDRLTRKKLVERVWGSDRRTVLVRFSAYGLKVGVFLMAWRRDTARALLRKLTRDETDILLGMLDRVTGPESAPAGRRSRGRP